MKKHLETILSHLSDYGQINDPYSATHVPIYHTATFDLKHQKADKVYDYTRTDNPTREALENIFVEASGGAGCVCTHTGIGAVALLFEMTLKSNSQILVEQDIYGGTYRLLKIYQTQHNVRVHFADFTREETVKNILEKNTINLILCESPTNPGLKIINIKNIANLAKQHQTLFAVDNSLATFASQKPLNLGADFEVFSTTKYVSGHGSVIAGALVSKHKEWAETARVYANAGGRSQNPFDVYCISLGVPTLFIRMKAHQQKALVIAKYLEQKNEVTKARYPGLPSHPQHELAVKQMEIIPGLITVDFQTKELAEQVVAKTKLFGEKASFGSPDSRIEIPAKISHASFSEQELAAIGINRSSVRMSIGLENVNDLIDDLEQAMQ